MATTLPTLLAGPILRRCTLKVVTVWIATSVEPTDIGLSVFRLEKDKWVSNPCTSGFQTVRLGERLWVSLAFATPDDGDVDPIFPRDTLLAYDLTLKGPAKKTWKLDELLPGGLLDISYPKLGMPTFYLQDKTYLRFLHGSCRNLHGEGKDAFVAGDMLLLETARDLANRPAYLFLTGDQVYSDSVAWPVLRHIGTLTPDLFGWEDHLPYGNATAVKKLSDLPVGSRKDYVEKTVKFTTGAVDNHLLGVVEFATIYLCAWNSELWPAKWDEDGSTSYYISKFGLKGKDKAKKVIENLELARSALPAVRRVLANTPTYMIFDDHEITDDWNIDDAWVQNVYGNAAGRRVVTNGLAAYWAFQAWGNDPDAFDSKFVKTVQTFFDAARKGSGKVAGADADALDDLLLKFRGWSFVAPTSPLTLFLDTRTRRQPEPKQASRLVDKKGYDETAKLVARAGYRKGETLILVSPVPVYGIWELEVYKRDVLVPDSGIYADDFEDWRANMWGFADIMSFVVEKLSPRYCIFVSGDVHYAYSANARFALWRGHWDKGYSARLDADGVPVPTAFLQLTSSPLKNSGSGERLAFSVADLADALAGNWLVGYDAPLEDAPDWLKEHAPKDPPVVVDGDFATLYVGDDRLWEEKFSYVETHGSGTTPVLANNNLGEVLVVDVTKRVKHWLHQWDGERVRSNYVVLSAEDE